MNAMLPPEHTSSPRGDSLEARRFPSVFSASSAVRSFARRGRIESRKSMIRKEPVTLETRQLETDYLLSPIFFLLAA